MPKTATELLQKFLKEKNIVLRPVIGNAEATESGKVILTPALNVAFEKKVPAKT